MIFIMQILESVPQVAKCKLSGAQVKSVIPIKINYKQKLTLVIPPKFLGLPIFSSFDFVFDLLLILEVLLANGHRRALEAILKYILTL